jgi:hypothetical protein
MGLRSAARLPGHRAITQESRNAGIQESQEFQGSLVRREQAPKADGASNGHSLGDFWPRNNRWQRGLSGNGATQRLTCFWPRETVDLGISLGILSWEHLEALGGTWKGRLERGSAAAGRVRPSPSIRRAWRYVMCSAWSGSAVA